MERRLQVVFLGTSPFGLPALRAMHAAGHTVRAVVTQPDRPSGRGRRIASPPVKKAAKDLGLPVLQPDRIADIVPEIDRIAPDAIVVAAYAQVIPASVIRSPKIAPLNIHPSLLPRYRGAAPVQWAIINGEEETGVTIFRIVRKMDAGPILAARAVRIEESETAGALVERLSHVGADLLLEVLDDLPGAVARERPQEEGEVTRAPRLKKEDGRLLFDQSPRAIRDRVRGLQPWPGAYAEIRIAGKEALRVGILEATAGAGRAEAAPGEIIEASEEGVTVAARDGRVVITRLQPEGGRPMAAADFLRGRPISPGDRFV